MDSIRAQIIHRRDTDLKDTSSSVYSGSNTPLDCENLIRPTLEQTASYLI